jgi:serine/threonine-protein kinase Stk1
MSDLQPLVPAPTDSEDGGHNLTYFAFAAGAKPVVSVEQAPRSELPAILAGRYSLERVLGSGGMGVVYRARDLLHEQFGDPDPYLAIKVLKDDIADSPDASVLLYSEFALTRHLCHPHVVRLHTFEVDSQCHRAFITMELMRGLTLDQMLFEQPEGLPWDEFHALALGMLHTLAHAHDQGVLHGDLKPGNLMLTENGLRLFDFGLGQAMEGVMPGLAQISRERFNAWTPNYAAPELLEGAPLSKAADVYAMACILYELVSGKHPFNRLTALQAREQKLERKLRRPKRLPKQCWAGLRRALALDPQRRQITARQLQEAFWVGNPSFMERWFSQRNG